MANADRHDLPLAVATHAANHFEVTLVQLAFDFYMTEAKREHLIGGRAYDSGKLDTEIIAPPRLNPARWKTQDGR